MLRRMVALLALGWTVSANAQVEDNAVWIDVRTPAEYASGHVNGALNIPWDAIATGVAALELAPDTPVYLYCGKGGRAEKAKEALAGEGFTALTNPGGIDDARKLAGE